MQTIQPALGSHEFITWQVSSPLTTHWRKATCQEVDCANFLNGWAVGITDDELGRALAARVEKCGKSCEKLTVDEARAAYPGKQFTGCVYVYIFAAGQPCFDQDLGRHVIQTGRPDVFSTFNGDYRQRYSTPKVLTADDWVDSFEEHQNARSEAQKKG